VDSVSDLNTPAEPPRIRRVLMTSDTVGGVWTFGLELAEALGEHGVEVVVAVLGGHPSPGQRVEAARIRNILLLSSEYKLEWMEDPWRDVAESGQWVLELEREYSPDIVHLNSFGHGSLPFHAPVVLTAHSCVVSWWRAVKREGAPPAWDRYREIVAKSLMSVAAVTAPSRAMAASLQENYGGVRADCRVIPNGRDSARFRRGAKEEFIFTAGRLWDEAKNAVAVARVAGRLSWPVYAAGTSDHPDGRTTAFEGCRVLGRLSSTDIAGWYSKAAIYALPARYEPFGLSALEAALSGCALVLGGITSLHEIWGDAAIFVDPEDERALADALEGLIADRTLREEMSERSYRRALNLDSRRMANQYLDLYRATVRPRQECVS
jgi:glycogen(starch) synthase